MSSFYVAKDYQGTTTIFSVKPDWVRNDDGKMIWHCREDKASFVINEDSENQVFDLRPGQIIELLSISSKRMPEEK